MSDNVKNRSAARVQLKTAAAKSRRMLTFLNPPSLSAERFSSVMAAAVKSTGTVKWWVHILLPFRLPHEISSPYNPVEFP